MKKILLVMIIMLSLTGCKSDQTSNKKENVEKGRFETLTLNINVTNKEFKDNEYSIYLIEPGTMPTESGAAMNKSHYGPFQINQSGEATIDLRWNYDIVFNHESKNRTEFKKFQVIVVAKEDKYLRNPLNKDTYIEFVRNDNLDTMIEIDYYSTAEKINIDITDKYPDGVLSLTFPSATFVIKLEFEEGYNPKNAYEVSIYKPSTTAIDGIGIYRIGRIAREFQYWDTPFFETDKLSQWSGTIVVSDLDTNERLKYEGFPKKITFDNNGKCNEGNVIIIKMVK